MLQERSFGDGITYRVPNKSKRIAINFKPKKSVLKSVAAKSCVNRIHTSESEERMT